MVATTHTQSGPVIRIDGFTLIGIDDICEHGRRLLERVTERENSLRDARIKLGAFLNRIESMAADRGDSLYGKRKTIYNSIGVNEHTAGACKRLARGIADEDGNLDPKKLREFQSLRYQEAQERGTRTDDAAFTATPDEVSLTQLDRLVKNKGPLKEPGGQGGTGEAESNLPVSRLPCFGDPIMPWQTGPAAEQPHARGGDDAPASGVAGLQVEAGHAETGGSGRANVRTDTGTATAVANVPPRAKAGIQLTLEDLVGQCRTVEQRLRDIGDRWDSIREDDRARVAEHLDAVKRIIGG